MTTPTPHHPGPGGADHDRLLELMADEVVGPLSSEDEAEMVRLLDKLPQYQGDETFLKAVAAADLCFMAEDARLEPLPSTLRARLIGAADTAIPAPFLRITGAPDHGGVRAGAGPTAEPRLAAWTGWVAAAACLLLAVSAWWPSLTGQSARDPSLSQSEPDPVRSLRNEILQTSVDPIVATLAALPDRPDPSVLPEVTGDVLWSDSRQQGVLRIKGLKPNDPTQSQYQLWIFDRTQPDRTPIDGGVFDVPSSEEVLVPIEAKLEVRGPFQFAITVEKPGGVVVTDRTRIALLGQVQGFAAQDRLESLREDLLALGATSVKADWGLLNPEKPDPAVAESLSGDVVWNDRRQQGVIRISGLAVNDPAKEQYQLWIFDKNQKESTPVDGGVFNVTSGGEVFIPIEAKLRVDDPTLFAITVEKSGGVVVSDRSRLATVAAVRQ